MVFLTKEEFSASLRLCVGVMFVFLVGSSSAFAQAPIAYRVSIPEPQHHWIQVEAVFPDLPAGPAHVVMSRTSPGRYAIHEFAKNVYDVQIDDGGGRALHHLPDALGRDPSAEEQREVQVVRRDELHAVGTAEGALRPRGERARRGYGQRVGDEDLRTAQRSHACVETKSQTGLYW